MIYQPFYELFPEIAEKETRTLTAINHPHLPADDYALLESYCNEPGCDCRRVFLNIASRYRQKIEAVITFGWENEKFYLKWLGFNDPHVLNQLKGPALNDSSPQSELAPVLLQEVTFVLQDKNYVDRLKRHYHMFKEAVNREDFESEDEDFVPRPKIGRNDPCPCGSRKKYKNCCGMKVRS
jgi:hypothetical protein